jgi:hypothetical protein
MTHEIRKYFSKKKNVYYRIQTSFQRHQIAVFIAQYSQEVLQNYTQRPFYIFVFSYTEKYEKPQT